MATATEIVTAMAMGKSKYRPELLVSLTSLWLATSTAAWGEVSVTPRVSVSETMTDNVRLVERNAQSEQITEITPGIRINISGTRLKTYFDLGLSQVVYAQNSAPNRTEIQNALNTFGTYEAIDNWVFVDFSGTISQQSVSAFGTQSAADSLVNGNQAEVSNYRVSPYVRGRLGQAADYEVRYSRSTTRSDSNAASDVDTANVSAVLSGNSAFRNLGWSANASRQTVDYSAGRATEADQFSLGLSYAITPQLNVFVSGGRESNDYASLAQQNSATHSFGVNWAPSETTQLSASRSQHAFGNTHSVGFQHRGPRSVWMFSDTRDVSSTPSQSGVAGLGSVYDLLFSQFASTEPDPVARAALVNAYLQTYGINPSATVVSSFLSSAVSLQRRQNLSFSLLGLRDTLTFMATRTHSSRLDMVSRGFDDLSAASQVRQQGFSVNLAHRLTPVYVLGVMWSHEKTSGDNNTQDIRLRSLNLTLTGRLGKRTSAVLGVRRVVFDGIAPYTENALIGNLIMQF